MTYDVLLIDPPWSYYGSQDKWGAAGKEYPLMTDSEILDLDIRGRLSKRAVVFIWATGPKLDLEFTAIGSWGLHYRGVAFTWVKTRQDRITPIGAQGVRPSIVKPTSEFVLAASNVKKGRPLALASEAIRQIVMAPKQEHSRKPDEVHERIEMMYPEMTKLEMFARRERPGWDVWGNEV